MSLKSTWYWLLLASGLFAFIYFYQLHHHRGPTGPDWVLPKLDAAAVNVLQVRLAKGEEIRAERTNDAWTLTKPLVYPADPAPIEKLLTNLAHLTPATYLSESEIRTHPNADEEYGLVTPQASLIVTQGNYRAHLLFGCKTVPGDQFFLKVVAREGLYVVDTNVLQALPRSAEDWRDRDLLHVRPLEFDRIAVTNNGKACIVGRESTNGRWRMVWPLMQARADNGRINEGLRQLAALRVQQFVSDDPRVDPEAFGLQSPDLELALAQGTNILAGLQLGKSPSNHADQVYARCPGQNTIVTLPKAELDAWRVSSVNDFRDHHLLELTQPVREIAVQGQDEFRLVAQTNGAWTVQPRGFAADGDLVTNLLSLLTNMTIVQFTKDVVTPLNWPEYGLAHPARRFVLETDLPNRVPGQTNPVIADLSFGFGTNQPENVFVHRADEESVYAVRTNDFAALPSASWQLRERRFWNFAVEDLASIIIRQHGHNRELVRRGDHEWSLGFGSQGIIEEAAIEESVRNLLATPALDWVAVGETNRVRFGFTNNVQQLTFRLKDGQQRQIEIGGDSPRGRYAAVALDGDVWIMELPFALYRYVAAYLSLPAN